VRDDDNDHDDIIYIYIYIYFIVIGLTPGGSRTDDSMMIQLVTTRRTCSLEGRNDEYTQNFSRRT
jgi:hypothetical protein